MRRPILLVLGLLLVVPVARAGDDAASALIPKSSPVCIKIASLARVDAVVKEVHPLLKAAGLGSELAPLEQMPASQLFFAKSGLDQAAVDATKPVYIGMVDEEPFLVFHAAEGAAWEGEKPLKDGFAAVVRSGAVLCGRPGTLASEARGKPAEMIDGDVVVHVFISELVAAHKEEVDQALADMAMGAGGAPGMPDEARAAMALFAGVAKDAVYGAHTFDYAMTWNENKLWTEGLLRTKPESKLRSFLARAGAPSDNAALIGLLPKDGLLYTDASTNPDWPLKEIAGLLDGALGEGRGEAVLGLVNMGAQLSGFMKGTSASSISLGGMMSMTMTQIAELKEGVEAAAVFEAYDVAKMNDAFAKLGLPLKMQLDRAVAKHGETELHRVTMQSEDPQMAMMFAMMQVYMAVEGGHFLSVMSPTAEDDLRMLLDRIRKGDTGAHPHAQAMSRLGRARNMGLTFNVGAIKPMMMMMAMMMPPDMVQGIQKLPDELYLSTAISMTGGDLHWRGDWPVKQILEVAEAVQKKPEPAGGGDEPFK